MQLLNFNEAELSFRIFQHKKIAFSALAECSIHISAILIKIHKDIDYIILTPNLTFVNDLSVFDLILHDIVV